MIEVVRYGGLLILVFCQRLSPPNAPYKIATRSRSHSDAGIVLMAELDKKLKITRQTSQLRCQEPLFDHPDQFDQAFLPIEFYLLYGFDREQFVPLCPETDKQHE